MMAKHTAEQMKTPPTQTIVLQTKSPAACTPLSDMDGFSPAKNGISELFSSGRTGLTPSGPIGKTPVGGYGGPGGLSPLHAHYKAQMAQNPGVAVPMSDDT